MVERDIQAIYNKAMENDMGMVLYARHPLSGLGESN
jgi:hypothetical protein